MKSRLGVGALFFVNGFVFASWVPHIPAVKRSLELSESALGALLLAMAGGAVVALPTAGWLVARFGSRRVTALAAAGFCIALAPILEGGTVFGVAAALMVFGAFNGTLDVAMNAQAVEVERLYRKPIMSSFHALFSLGGLAGAAIAGGFMAIGVGDTMHVRTVSIVALTVVLLACSGLLRVPPLPRETAVFARPSGPLLILGLLTFMALLAEGAIADWSAVYLHQHLTADAAMAAAGFAAFSGAMAAGRFTGDWFAARIAPRRLLAWSGGISLTGLAMTAATTEPVIAIAGFGAAGIGLANAIPLTFSAAGRVPGIAPGVALAAVASTGYLGYLAGPPLIGLISESVGLSGGVAFVALACGIITVGARKISTGN